MLVQSDRLAGGRLTFSGGALGGLRQRDRSAAWAITNGRAFGSVASVPQGYNSPSALAMPLVTGGQISARFRADAFYTADLRGIGNISATASAEADMIAGANVLLNGYATFAGEAFWTASIRAQGNMSANMDILARPSAFDISQEVWQSKAVAYNAAGTMGAKVNAAGGSGDPWAVTLEGSYTAADLLRIAAAVLAGSATGTNQPGTTVFKSVDGTKDRVTATQTDGARTITDIDPT
jgi:hypothetical protein